MIFVFSRWGIWLARPKLSIALPPATLAKRYKQAHKTHWFFNIIYIKVTKSMIFVFSLWGIWLALRVHSHRFKMHSDSWVLHSGPCTPTGNTDYKVGTVPVHSQNRKKLTENETCTPHSQASEFIDFVIENHSQETQIIYMYILMN